METTVNVHLRMHSTPREALSFRKSVCTVIS